MITKEWRSASVKALMDFIDENRKRSNAYGNALPGSQPRLRLRPKHAILSIRKPIAALPLNFYDKAWYDSLMKIQQTQLGAAEPMDLPEIDDSSI